MKFCKCLTYYVSSGHRRSQGLTSDIMLGDECCVPKISKCCVDLEGM